MSWKDLSILFFTSVNVLRGLLHHMPLYVASKYNDLDEISRLDTKTPMEANLQRFNRTI